MNDVAWLAWEIREQDVAFKSQQIRLLADARHLYRALGYGNLSHFCGAFRSGDADGLRGLDDVAERLAERYPELLGSNPEHKLFDLLTCPAVGHG